MTPLCERFQTISVDERIRTICSTIVDCVFKWVEHVEFQWLLAHLNSEVDLLRITVAWASRTGHSDAQFVFVKLE
jgi:hypothetical protein